MVSAAAGAMAAPILLASVMPRSLIRPKQTAAICTPLPPIPTTAEEGYHYADRSRIEPLINEHTRAILITNPGNPTGVVLSEE